MKQKKLQLILILIAALILSSCRGREIDLNYPVGSVWNVPIEDGEANWDAASTLAKEQYAGFTLANEDAGYDVYPFGEGNREDDVQVAIRTMVEENEIVALLGATTNQATMRSAALANFFNLPIIIPSADGTNIFPENNFWAFRLAAPSEAYSTYLFKDLLGDPTRENRVMPEDITIAILYEQNTFGESAAVAAATEAMAQLIEIEAYSNFDPTTPDPEDMNEMVQQAFDERVDVAYLISNHPETAAMLVKSFSSQLLEGEELPLLIGQGSGFTSRDFLDSVQAEDVLVMRQEITSKDCPAVVRSLAEAQTYAALHLLDSAVQDAERKGLSALGTSFIDFLRPNSTSKPIIKFREIVRDVLKETNKEVPCLGQVAFDNTGQNKFLRLEILVTENGKSSVLPADDFLLIVKERVTN